jgi:hypothetical protein
LRACGICSEGSHDGSLMALHMGRRWPRPACTSSGSCEINASAGWTMAAVARSARRRSSVCPQVRCQPVICKFRELARLRPRHKPWHRRHDGLARKNPEASPPPVTATDLRCMTGGSDVVNISCIHGPLRRRFPGRFERTPTRKTQPGAVRRMKGWSVPRCHVRAATRARYPEGRVPVRMATRLRARTCGPAPPAMHPPRQ